MTTGSTHDGKPRPHGGNAGLGRLPPVASLFPASRPGAIRWFWVRYWACFFLFLPWIFVRQVFVSCGHFFAVLWTWNRLYTFHGGALQILYMASPVSLLLTTLFGERFTAIQYRDTLIDPGPPFARKRLLRHLQREDREVRAIVATHAHEEHIGNAALAATHTQAPVYGTDVTLAAIRTPERISLARRTLIGQPAPAPDLDLRSLGAHLDTPAGRLDVIESPGHCEGHASLFDHERGVLLAGDSFLHMVFTSPNRDVSGAEWIETLERYDELDIHTLVGTHGHLHTRDRAIPRVPFVVRRADPNAIIRGKLAFLRWATAVVREGERRQLPYKVIEACLFPWSRWWSWGNWFIDESGRLFSGGEFSRTYFVRSLAADPAQVPPRFPLFGRVVAWAARLLRSRR